MSFFWGLQAHVYICIMAAVGFDAVRSQLNRLIAPHVTRALFGVLAAAFCFAQLFFNFQ